MSAYVEYATPGPVSGTCMSTGVGFLIHGSKDILDAAEEKCSVGKARTRGKCSPCDTSTVQVQLYMICRSLSPKSSRIQVGGNFFTTNVVYLYSKSDAAWMGS
jgi:hypothetical protein